MSRFSIRFVGLQLLLLAYTAQSFVLLTANMQDIKKIASKFVSDELAEKIAEFLVKASGQLSGNMLDGPEKIKHDTSKENEEYERIIARQSNERQRNEEFINKDIKNDDRKQKVRWSKASNEQSVKDTEKIFEKELYKKPKKSRDEFSSEHSRRPSTTNTRDGMYKLGENSDRLSKIPQVFWTSDKKNYNKSDSNKVYKKQQHRPNKNFQMNFKQPNDHLTIAQSNKSNKERNYIQSSNNHPKRDFNAMNRDAREPDENRPSSLKFKKIIQPSFKSNFLGESAENNNKRVGDSDKISDSETTGMNIEKVKLTSKKEKTDFDQYDNRNYPKAEFVATSGLMMLPKISGRRNNEKGEDNWWEKELTTNVATKSK